MGICFEQRFGKRKGLIGIFFAAVLLATVNVEAGIMLDQSFDTVAARGSGGPLIFTSQSAAQTFTAGLDGILDQVDLQIYRSTINAVNDDLTLTISRGMPGGSDPRSISIDRSLVPLGITDNFVNVDVSSLGISVMSGEVFSLELTYSGAGDYVWRDALSSPLVSRVFYSGGSRFSGSPGNPWFEQPTRDLGFQTFVNTQPNSVVPEPGTIATMSCVFACCLGYGPLRRKRSTAS